MIKKSKDIVGVIGHHTVNHLKIQSNRKVRRFKKEIQNGNSYRRLFDYWWNYD